ncbi:MAG TPA: flagellar export chaperone FlgN [Longimicrobiales bacterium]
MSGASTASGTAATPRPTVETLEAAIRTELRLLDELGQILRAQREGVAADDVQRVDESIFAAHRVLQTIGEARRSRRTLLMILGGRDDITLDELDAALGPRMTDALRDARDELQRKALALSDEVSLNRHVLRGALGSDDELLRALCGAPRTDSDPAPGRRDPRRRRHPRRRL